MINEFISLNKRAIFSGLKVLIIILSVISLTVCTMLFVIGEMSSLIAYLVTIFGISFVLPFILTTIACLRGYCDLKVSRKNFNSPPFCDLESIGFQKILLNEHSKWSFVQEVYRGEINGFIIDIDVDTQREHKYLRFRFSSKPRPEDMGESTFDIRNFNYPNIVSGFSKILTKYHYKKHELKSLQQLENELIELTEKLN